LTHSATNYKADTGRSCELQSIEIRKPLRSEIPQLAELGSNLFQQTFEGLYSDSDLKGFLQKVHSPAGVAYDWEHDCEFWIAEAAGQGGAEKTWVGYCKAGPVKVPVDVSTRRALELRQIYVDRAFHRRGIGEAFMQRFLELCREREIEVAYVSCYTENSRALDFYAHFGFEIVGTYDFEVGQHRDQDHILCKKL
jgi:diamine N-acetyltransferase